MSSTIPEGIDPQDVRNMMEHIQEVWGGSIRRFDVIPLSTSRGDGDDELPPAVAIHAYNSEGRRVDARQVGLP